MSAPLKLVDWLRGAAERLAAAGLESPSLEARRLAQDRLRLTPAQIIGSPDRPLSPGEAAELDALVRARCRHEPLQYVLRTVAFRHLELEVGPGVFIPRPETEGLVERVLPHLKVVARARPPRALELCLGSGAILAALLTECPTALGRGVELSPVALEYARRNIARVGAADRARLFLGDLYAPLHAAGVPAAYFDLIIANPPYIPDAALGTLPEDVRLHEPELALRGGTDGTDAIARIVGEAAAWLEGAGWLALEIDESHGDRVLELLRAAGFGATARIESDLAGRTRYAVAQRAPGQSVRPVRAGDAPAGRPPGGESGR